VSVAAVAIGSACMGGAEESRDRLTAIEARQGFLRVTGDELVVHEWEGLVGKGPPADVVVSWRTAYRRPGAPVPPSERALERKYGLFTIVVYLGRVPAPRPPDLVDEKGVRWYREQHEAGYQVVGETRYGGNVVLRWFPRPERMETNAQWRRLDAALSEVVRLRGG